MPGCYDVLAKVPQTPTDCTVISQPNTYSAIVQ